MLLKHGTLYLMDGETVLEDADLRVEGERIAEIGKDLEPLEGEELLDCTGKFVFPGFIDTHCHIGIDELGLGFEGNDTNEVTDPLTPEVDALDGVNPHDKAFRQAVEAGVTTVFTGPGSANVVGGLFVCLRTWGNSVDAMQIPGVRAMKCAFGENPKRCYGKQGKKPMTRMETAALLRKALQDAKNYGARKEAAEKKGEPFDIDLGQENMLKVVKGEMPLKAHAHRADDILTSARIAKEFGVKLTMDHCTEGHLVADELAENPYPALIGPTPSTASKVELKDKGYEAIVELVKRGKLCSVITDHPVISIDYLPICAGLAVREGLSEMDALRAITINAAKILGLEKELGSLEKGKIANIAVYDGMPLCSSSSCLATIGEGSLLYLKEGALLPEPAVTL